MSSVRIEATPAFHAWLLKLKDDVAAARIAYRLQRIAETGNAGDSKPVGEGVFELRVDYGPGYRLYYAQREQSLLLLLVGGDKGSQKRDIAKAKRILAKTGKDQNDETVPL